MCNRYVTPEEREIEDLWHVGRANPGRWWDKDVFPRGKGAFIRRARDEVGYSRELVAGQWGLIPWFAKEAKLPYSTNNARSEELEDKATYRQPWARGQRCVIPALAFDEPYWGPYEAQFKRCEWWRFRRADGAPWGLAGIWNTWLDKASGEVFETYSMLTVNADGHPIMGKMHRNVVDSKTKIPLPIEKQDKRSVISIELEDVDLWLTGTIEQVKPLLRPPAMQVLEAGPA